MPQRHAYGYRPGPVDQRDLELKFAWNPFKALPKVVDLRPQLPPIWNQLNLGACTAFATLAAWYHCKQRQIAEGRDDDKNIFHPAFLFQYYNTRILEKTIEFDSGATIGNAYKALWKYGICPDSDVPYVVEKFSDEPPLSAYNHAKDSQLLNYYRVSQNLYALKSCLADGYCITFGMGIYDSFEDPNGVAKTGVMVRPKLTESLLGGHALTIVGYDDDRKIFIVRNSWGANWGHGGYFTAPYDVILDRRLAMDFYSPRKVK